MRTNMYNMLVTDKVDCCSVLKNMLWHFVEHLVEQCVTFYASASSRRRRRYVVRSSVRLLSVRSHLFHVTRYLFLLSGGISVKLATYVRHVSANCWKGFRGQRSKAKVICVQMCVCYNGGGIHFDGVASRLKCYVYTMWGKKLPCFIFAISLSNLSLFW